ncbi:hypothetical protein, partial [Micromonospora wenchangensis]|uniref:hypothetical protein n=1 Tax=Micromonospora wenchangensis TaxID=1185415 RepID=UPI00380BFF7F
QKPVEQQSRQQTNVAKGIRTKQTKKACPARGKNNWHWLYKHPVEFSKNNHTPTRPPQQRQPDRGISFAAPYAPALGTFTTLPGGIRHVKPLCHDPHHFNHHFPHTTNTPDSHRKHP